MENKNSVIICNKLDPVVGKAMTTLEVTNFGMTVDEFSEQIAKHLKIDKNAFDIVYFGKMLDKSRTLDFYDIESGTMLYLLKKKVSSVESSPAVQIEFPDDPDDFNLSTEGQEQCIALKSAFLNSSFRHTLENLCDFEIRESLMTVNPELRKDPSMLGILTDYELLNSLLTGKNIQAVLQRYPHFLEVSSSFSATFHEETNSRSTFSNFPIDVISEDEEMDESETSSVSSTNTTGSLTSNRLNEAHRGSFSHMLMQAYLGQMRNSNNNQQSQPGSSGNVITPQMLQQALQTVSPSSSNTSVNNLTASPQTSRHNQSNCENLLPLPTSNPYSLSRSSSANMADLAAPSPSTVAPPPPPPRPDTRTPAQILIGWAPQLRQLRELGITDDIVAIQALEATNGDVQAAVNIIFSDMS